MGSCFPFENSKWYLRNLSKDPIDTRSRQMEDPLIIGNICKMNMHLGILYLFMHIYKLDLYIKVIFLLKPEF